MRIRSISRDILPQRLTARLVLLVAFSAALAAALATLAMLVIAWGSAEATARVEAHQNARSLAFALSAPLAFQDSKGAQEVLSLLAHRPEVAGAWVRDDRNQVIHSFGSSRLVPDVTEGGSLREAQLIISEPILAGTGGDRIGTVTLRIDLSAVRQELRGQGLAAILASLLAIALTVGLSQQLARRISVPVVQLADAARALTADWSRRDRLPTAGPGEVGVAVEAFNRMVDELGRRDAALGELTDELRRSASEAQQARLLAEQASFAKTRFLANMSHELRSPLNGVIGAAQLLQKADGDPALRAELWRIIQTSGSNLLDLIDSVLDVSRIEAGVVKLENEPFNLIHCIESALAPAAASAAVKNLRLDCHIEADVPVWHSGDNGRVRQLLQNLLGNAVKFTEKGTVSLRVSRDPEQDGVTFCIADTGVGIPSHLLQSIFQPFQQGDPSATRRFGGSGLGLAICRDVARLMNGEVRVESTPGEGSSFTLRLPLQAIGGKEPDAGSLVGRVLCFEPDRDRRRSLAALLLRFGVTARFLDGLGEVREHCAARDNSAPQRDVWLIAVDHPQGSLVLQALQSARPSPRVCALGMNAEGGRLDGVLSRPVMPSMLRAFLASPGQSLDKRTGDTTRLRTLRARVLLVEDDVVNRLVLRQMVEGPEFRCVVAAGGAEALQLLAQERFDAVLMDWQMPDLDGLEVTRRLRAGMAGELNRAVVVIALTANAFAEDRSACMAAGMNDFLSKPVQTRALLGCLQRWCRDEPAQTAPEAVTAAGSTPRNLEPLVYDPAPLAELPMTANGTAVDYINELLQLFCTSVSSALPQMETAAAAGDSDTLKRHAHMLKSSAAQVGAMAFAQLAAALDARLYAGGTGTVAEVAALRRAFETFVRVACPITLVSAPG